MEKVIRFYAGREFVVDGKPAPWWVGAISYQWDCAKQAFHVCVKQVLGTGTVTNTVQYEYHLKNCESVNTLIDTFQELKAHYKKVYER